MPGHFEFEEIEKKTKIIYKRCFISNPEKYLEVHEDFYKQKIKEEEEERKNRNKVNNKECDKNNNIDTK
jgi:hypothetical protein